VTGRRWLRAASALVTVVVVAFVARALARNWTEFRTLHVTLAVRPLWIVASALLVLLTYVAQIQSWRAVLAGWRQRLSLGAAARTWSLANLGRYVPGKVWSVAGLVVLAERAGVERAPAAASAFASQALAVGTGAIVVAACTPHATSPLRLGAAVLAAVVTVGLLVWPPAVRLISRLAQAERPLEPLRPAAVLQAVAFSLCGWVIYGIAFWALARGLVAPASGALSLSLAAGAFALGYIVGWLALFAPGGVGVRELVFVGLLAPVLGSGGAVAVSVASRVLLTATEAAAAALTLPLGDK